MLIISIYVLIMEKKFFKTYKIPLTPKSEELVYVAPTIQIAAKYVHDYGIKREFSRRNAQFVSNVSNKWLMKQEQY